jgi:hypothetical protein
MAPLVDRDFLAGVGAGTFAVVSLWVTQLQALCSPQVAGGFALVALGYWWKKGRAPADPPPKPVPLNPPRVIVHAANDDPGDTKVDGDGPMGVA